MVGERGGAALTDHTLGPIYTGDIGVAHSAGAPFSSGWHVAVALPHGRSPSTVLVNLSFLAGQVSESSSA